MPNIPNEDTNQKYICAGRCPELDGAGDKHCICYDPTAECPCGNIPIWIKLEECDK